jgi:transcriptional regulator with GAF, ATPase, and Fis domain
MVECEGTPETGQGWKGVLSQAATVAPTESTVLIRGETGTGKELVAREIHRLSPRRNGPFVPINCGALTGELVSSDLFGHEKGAFTGALLRRTGRVESAAGGTLFLDEVGDLAGDLQVRLLRLLQEREYERVGGTETLSADVRVVAATHCPLERLRSEGRFRDDLFYRLNVFPIRVPPLRERPEEIGLLLASFVERFSKRLGKTFAHIDRQSIRRCEEYPWPGNVRELENLVERAALLCPEPVFTLNPFAHSESSAPGTAESTLDSVIRAHLVRTLKRCGGKIYGPDGAARLLGLRPSTLQSKLKRLGIRREAPDST